MLGGGVDAATLVAASSQKQRNKVLTVSLLFVHSPISAVSALPCPVNGRRSSTALVYTPSCCVFVCVPLSYQLPVPRGTTRDVKRSTLTQQPTTLVCQLECATLPWTLSQEA